MGNDASYTIDSFEYKYLKAKVTNRNTNIYSFLGQSSSDNFSFIVENEESSETTYFLNKLKVTRTASINRLIIDDININFARNEF